MRARHVSLAVVMGVVVVAAAASADRNTLGRPKPAPPAAPPAARTDAPAPAPARAQPQAPKADAVGDKVLRDGVAVMAGPGSFFAKVGEVGRGTRIEVVSDRGAWVEMRAGGLAGFIPRSALESRERGTGSLSSGYGSSQASASSETAAVKGFNDDVERAHAGDRGQDWAGLDWMDGQTVSPEQVRAFLAERGLDGGSR